MNRRDTVWKWSQRLAARLDTAEVERLANSLLTAVDQVATTRWDAAVRRAATLPGDVRPEKVKALTTSMSRELGACGATVGAAAATPVVGTAATLLATTAELAWFTARAGDLILTIAALHGRPAPTVDERRAWVLAVLIYGGSARDGFAKALHQANTGLRPATDNRLSVGTLQTVNRIMSKMIISRYGTRRGAVALGQALPFGVGALVGGGANFLAVRALAKHADQFFARLPYSAVDVTWTEVGGALPAST